MLLRAARKLADVSWRSRSSSCSTAARDFLTSSSSPRTASGLGGTAVRAGGREPSRALMRRACLLVLSCAALLLALFLSFSSGIGAGQQKGSDGRGGGGCGGCKQRGGKG